MKSLILLRHAEAQPPAPGLPDFARGLTERGAEEAAHVGLRLRERGLLPDVVIASPAVRALRTAEIVLEAAQLRISARPERRVYEATVGRLVEVTSEVEDEAGSVLLVGHNPGLEGLIHHLTGELRPLPTAGLAVVMLNVERWEDMRARCGQLA